MTPEKMIGMANQIASFFNTQPGDDQVEKVAAHIQDFWEPRMRQQLLEHIQNEEGQGLDHLVLQAAKQLH